MAQTLVARFEESPFSPWGLSQGTSASLLDASPRFQSVGCIGSVNSQVIERGLQSRGSLPLLVADMQRAKAGIGPQKAVSQSHAHKPDQSQDHKITPSPEKQSDAKLIEFATFPGFSPAHPTPLPHGMVTLDQMKRVTRAQTSLAIKHDGYREYWKNIFYSPTSQAIFQDTFWWFFLHKYQHNQEVQKLLFGRVAVNYVKLLFGLTEERWRDVFFKSYPDVIAQCVYSTFIYAFPTSWNNFDDDFKNELCNTISLWQVGTQTVPNSWQKWNLAQLEPPNLLKHVSKKEKSPKSPPKRFNLDALVRKAKEKERSAHWKTVPRTNELAQYSSGLGISFSTLASSPSKQETPLSCSSKVNSREAERKTVSIAQLESALTVESQRLQQLQLRRGGVQTHGEATPPTESTATQRRRIEVAKEQLGDLKKTLELKKLQQEPKKGKAATGSSNVAKCEATTKLSQAVSADLVQLKSRPVPAQVQQKGVAPVKAPASQQVKQQSAVHSLSSSVSQKEKLYQTLQDKIHQQSTQLQKPSSPSSHLRQQTPAQSWPKPRPVPFPPRQQQQLRALTQPTRAQVPRLSNVASKGDQTREPEATAGKETAAVKASGHAHVEGNGGTWKEKALALRKKNEESSVSTAGPKFKHVVFDICGHSPLVKHYLQERKLSYDSRYSLLMKRTEIGQQPPADAPTYEELLRESIQVEKKNRAQFKKQYARQKQAMTRSEQERKKAMAQHEQDVKKVLSNKKEVKQLSNELMIHLSKRRDRKAATTD